MTLTTLLPIYIGFGFCGAFLLFNCTIVEKLRDPTIIIIFQRKKHLVLTMFYISVYLFSLIIRLFQVTLIILIALSHVVQHSVADNIGHCKSNGPLKPRPHSVSILEFGAVGDGKALNTLAFQNAIFYLKSFADKGGAQLFVPSGKWLTGSFNLTSHLTLFLEKGAVILGSQVILLIHCKICIII